MAVSSQDVEDDLHDSRAAMYDENPASVPEDFTDTLTEALDGDRDSSDVVDDVLDSGEKVTVPEVAQRIYRMHGSDGLDAWEEPERYDMSEWRDNELAYAVSRVEDGLIGHEDTRFVGERAVNVKCSGGLTRAYAEEVGDRNYEIGAQFFEIEEFQK